MNDMYKMSETKEQLLEDYSIYIFSHWLVKLLHTFQIVYLSADFGPV